MIQVQFYDTDPRQFLAECNMPSIPESGDLIELDGKTFAQHINPRRWKLIEVSATELMWVVEVEVIIQDP